VSQETISAAYAQKILQGPLSGNLAVGPILDDCGIKAEDLENPESRIYKSDFTRLVLAAIEQTEDEFLGFAGSRGKVKPGSFSMMSHAVINCPDLSQAMHRCAQFYDLFDLQVSTDFYQDDEGVQFRFFLDDENISRSFAMEASLFLSIRFFSWLVGKNIIPKCIHLDYSVEESSSDFKNWLPTPILYDQSCNQLTIEVMDARLPLVQTPVSLAEFLKHSLNDLLSDQTLETSLELQIKSIVNKEGGNNLPDFVYICDRLNMTTQTLRRRLRKENTSYREIKDNIRRDAALTHLSKARLSIDEIALLMGFSEASSFHRAFKNWTGQTPSAYRKRHLST